MIFFDSHCHLDDHLFKKDFDEVMDRALNNNVLGMTVVGVDDVTSRKAIDLADKYSGIYASVGFHPHYADRCSNNDLDNLIEASKDSKVVAWGEIGLDFNRMYSDPTIQECCFIRQLEIADDLKIPIILHERESKGKLIEILAAHPNRSRVAVVHCFSGSSDEMERYLEMGFYIGVTGIVSILKRGKYLRDLVKFIPSNRLLVETDAPYLIPAPHKNKIKRNEPAFVKTILLKLAEVRQEEAVVLAKQVWENTCSFFNINPKHGY